MASPGTDAAEGDEGRSTAPSARATGWRIPSVDRTESAIPGPWLAPATDTPSEPTGADPKTTRRRWPLGRRRRERAAETLAFPDPVDLDLVALEPDDEDDHAWSELTASLASLGEGARGDTATATPDTGGSPDNPWSLLVDERERHPPIDPARPIEPGDRVENEFWA